MAEIIWANLLQITEELQMISEFYILMYSDAHVQEKNGQQLCAREGYKALQKNIIVCLLFVNDHIENGLQTDENEIERKGIKGKEKHDAWWLTLLMDL